MTTAEANLFIDQCIKLIEQIFGSESDNHKQILILRDRTKVIIPNLSSIAIDDYFNNLKDQLLSYLDNCIETLNKRELITSINTVFFINIFIFIASLYWAISKPDLEPLIAALTALSILISQLFPLIQSRRLN